MRLRRLWRRHRCPPDISLRILINEQLIVGPVTGEELAYIVRFGSAGEDAMDLLDPDMTGYRDRIGNDIQILAKYLPAKRR